MISMDKEKILSQIKRDFFCYRNGLVADGIRKIYPVGTQIFGLTLPQLSEIAKKYPKNLDLGLSLWTEKNTRESRLLALYLIPPLEISSNQLVEMINDVRSIEEAELLPFKILRYSNYRNSILESFKDSDSKNDLVKHCIKMFQKNLNL